MTDDMETTTGGSNPRKSRRNERLSADGLWESFPKVTGLLRYVPSGTYFGRTKVNGKVKRRTLDTTVFTTAKLRLPDTLKELRKPEFIAGTFGQARADYERETDSDHTLAPRSKEYRLRCLDRLVKTWPGLDALTVDRITEADCRAWAARPPERGRRPERYAIEYSPQFFNNLLVYFRIVLTRAGLGHDKNPAMKIERLGLKPKRLTLPEPKEFDRLLAVVETSGAAQAQDCADLIRFLAYSGCRISEAAGVTWQDVDFKTGEIRVHSAKNRRTSDESETRDIPVIPPMKTLLERLQREQKPKPEDRVNVLAECQGALTRGCKLIGIHRITHHDLRHLFASACIESGVDLQTLSRWLGHSDGGALCQRVYGHLRKTHSLEMARKVTFGQAIMPENVVPMVTEGRAAV